MSKTTKLVLAFALCFFAFFGEKIVSFIKDNVEIVNTPSIDIVEPSLSYKAVVKKIVDTDITREDAKQISDFFLQVSDVVEFDPGFIKTTGNFREFNMTSGGLNFGGLELKDKYPNLGEHIDECIVASIGKEDKDLTDKQRKDLTDCLDAIAWAVHQ